MANVDTNTLSLGRDRSYLIKRKQKHSDSTKKVYETDII